jgi:hypothetical protein
MSSILQSIGMSLGIYLVSLAIRKGIDWDRIYAPLEARKNFKEEKKKWPWCESDRITMTQLIEWNRNAPKYYEYAPLNRSREIRLLRVSCVGNPKQFICELIPTSLNSLSTQYLAISYTWGSAAPYSTVTFSDSKVLDVSKSVFTILNTLFSPGETMHVWIDSLCINQSDDKEKSHQVRLMDEIYSKAQRVVICLGEATHDSDRAMDFIHPLRNAIRAARLAQEDESLATAESIFQQGRFDLTSPSWIALGNLFRRPWFQRIWVIQEVVMGRDPVFICGDRAIEWDLMHYITTRLFQHSLDNLFTYNPDDPIRPLPGPDGVGRLMAINEVRAMKQGGESENFQDTLIGMYSFKCSNPRDKIYGLLGIATDTGDVILDPDYGASVEEVFTRTARYLLQRDDSIVILHHAGIGNTRKYESLPSWVPQWEGDSDEDDRLCLGGMHKWSRYNAAAGSLPKVYTSGSEILIIQGVIVDIVSDLSSVRRKPDLDGEIVDMDDLERSRLAVLEEDEKMVGRVRSAKTAMSELYPGGFCTWKEAYWRTLIANSALTKPAPESYGEYFDIWKRRLQVPAADEELDLAHAHQNRLSSIFNQACSMAATNRRLFGTEKGLIGLTSSGTFLSDRVCIFLGGVTPFIIRENTLTSAGVGRRTWILVGEAYVHGLMDGEGLNLSKMQDIHFI